MLDVMIRAAVECRLRELHGHDPSTLYRHELGLCMGETRVDVAAINGQISGCEIKSSRDRLNRLPRQVELYGQVLDAAVLVVEGRHCDRATDLLPEWWGIWIAEEVDGGAHLTVARPAQLNQNVQAMPTAQLLWREEALDELRLRGQARGLSSKARWYVWQRLVEVLEFDELRSVVRERLKARPEWSGGR